MTENKIEAMNDEISEQDIKTENTTLCDADVNTVNGGAIRVSIPSYEGDGNWKQKGGAQKRFLSGD